MWISRLVVEMMISDDPAQKNQKKSETKLTIDVPIEDQNTQKVRKNVFLKWDNTKTLALVIKNAF